MIGVQTSMDVLCEAATNRTGWFIRMVEVIGTVVQVYGDQYVALDMCELCVFFYARKGWLVNKTAYSLRQRGGL